MVPQAEKIAPRPAKEPNVPTESTVFREGVPVTEHPELDEQPKVADQRQTAEP